MSRGVVQRVLQFLQHRSDRGQDQLEGLQACRLDGLQNWRTVGQMGVCCRMSSQDAAKRGGSGCLQEACKMQQACRRRTKKG